MHAFIRIGLLASLLMVVPCPAAEFALRDKDVVVFLGDSITAARTYGKVVENYTLLRFPERRVQFINAGHGGDTAAGGLARLERDVFQKHATVLLVAYGINDIGWGMRANAEHKQKYLDAIRGIVQQCKEHKVRVFICSAAVTGADPRKSENDFLQTMCDEGMAISRSMGEGSIDIQRTMREIQKRIWEANERETDPKKRTTLHAEDTIHLNDLGQLAMAYAIIKGLNAPSDVSSVEIQTDPHGKPSLLAAEGCKITELHQGANGLAFTRRDQGLPINFGLLGGLNFRFIPIPEQLNRYMLTIRDLPAGQYEISVDGRSLGKVDASRLEKGLNISSMTADPWQPGGDWDAQAGILKMLTDAEHEILMGQRWTEQYLQVSPERRAIEKSSKQTLQDLRELKRKIARPEPYRFVVRKVD